MIKVLTISALLTIVYSWDEVIRVVRIFLNGLFRRKIYEYYKGKTDQVVGPIVMMAAIPITLAGILAYHPESLKALLYAGLALLIISILAAGSGVFVRRMRAYNGTGTNRKFAALTYAVFGLLSPLASPVLIYQMLPRAELARITFWLALPPLCGLAIAYGNRETHAPTQLLPYLDALTMLLVIGIIAIITAKLLSRAFNSYKIENLFSYIRIILGIVLAAVIVVGIWQ